MANKPVKNSEETLSVTSLKDLQKYSEGTIVRLPDFAEGQPFVAKIRRPSMLILAKSGKIPNALLGTANELFMKGSGGLDTDDPSMMGNFYDTCKVICEAALVEPTMDDIEAAGLELTDAQLMAIFSYSQSGVKALEPFR